MRADRLVAILMLLQTRGKVTAAEVAAELEISERTARRDLDALGQAGLPVYAHPGRNGGWQLLGDGRTDLSGLTAAEARALFLVAGPAHTSPEVKAALRKLVRALPEPMRPSATAAAQAIVIDPAGWDRSASGSPRWFDEAQRAVVDAQQIHLGYVDRDGNVSHRRVHPLGLAAKGSVWYLVGDTDHGLRTFRVDRVKELWRTGEPAVRPAGFELEAAWRLIADRVDALRAPMVARGVVDRDYLRFARMVFGTRLRIGAAVADDRIAIEIRGHSERGLAAEIAGFGRAIEISDPEVVRDALLAVGRELVETYG